ncbi:MAG TPA: sel1 repeat family protein [Gammaproteobacteria bacterium]|nr:sel1 repeat family protein [Gammaproteobacteria bacterium]
MNRWAKCIVFVLAMVFSNTAALAAVDYILEQKFHAELVKAEQGDAKAQYAIGEMYEKGRGVEKDPRQAFSWYSKATQQGNMRAEYKLGMAYLNGIGIRKNYRKAHDWLNKSSNQGYARAQYSLGTLYENGLGMTQDLDKALEWYKRALRGGYDVAATGMQRVNQRQKRQREKLSQLRQKALATAKKLKEKARLQPKPVEPATALIPLTTKQRIQAGGWQKLGKAVEYLPSANTHCEDLDSRIECESITLMRNIGIADISFQTKATLSHFKEDGSFTISYRNNVLKITITDEEFAGSGAKLPVREGWQETEHKLTCVFEDDTQINCKKNKLRNIKLHR